MRELGHVERSGDGGRCHEELVRSAETVLSFLLQLQALLNTKPMLFVNDHKA